MSAPRRKITLRVLSLVIALLALDFSAMAWVWRENALQPQIPKGTPALISGAFPPDNPLVHLLTPVIFFFAPVALILTLIYLYTPPRIGVVLVVILLLALFLAFPIVFALRHS